VCLSDSKQQNPTRLIAKRSEADPKPVAGTLKTGII
jgi:hypothetical protein